MLTLVALGLLGGAVAKSAQLPLQTWLPDAMEGPTPVSALIHAATMVTAGVYLIVRTHPLFELAPNVQDTAAGLGTATLLIAGLIALVQTDIKRVIAYSTMSQIGYMFLGAGIGAYANAMFLLMAHAFFKALLFLGAGIVIHALAGEQDIRKMGGLPEADAEDVVGDADRRARARRDPAALRLLREGLDPRLGARRARTGTATCCSRPAMVGTFLTGLYTFRMLFIVFGGEQSAYVQEHPPHAHGDRVAQWSMGLTVGGADRARGGRRLDPVRRPSGRRHRLARARSRGRSSRRPARRRRSRASLAVALRPGRDRRRLVDLLGPACRRRHAAVGRARAQVLLRRALQRPLLLAGGRGLARCLDGSSRARSSNGSIARRHRR